MCELGVPAFVVVIKFGSKPTYQRILNMDGDFLKIRIGLITLNKMDKQRKKKPYNGKLCFRWLKKKGEIYILESYIIIFHLPEQIKLILELPEIIKLTLLKK